jgi:peptide-methionine (S)-S-oxide reductase
MENQVNIAIFGGGCFWCTEAVFKMLKGVLSVVPGYAGGTKKDPTYVDVLVGDTGHAEVIKVEYDPAKISFGDLLMVFFASHDPTTPNRQGGDIGPQYRSMVFYTDEKEKEEIEKRIKEIDRLGWGGKVVTEVLHLGEFYPAESYHQDFFARYPDKMYCQIIINPKLK